LPDLSFRAARTIHFARAAAPQPNPEIAASWHARAT
jgi:hypothetical protein